MQTLTLKPHTHAERAAVIEQLVPLWQRMFGERLLAIAADASYARGSDFSYSDLEMNVFIREHLPGEAHYLQRIVDGMLVEVLYYTPEEYVQAFATLNADWHIAGSDVLLPVYNAPFIADLLSQVQRAQPTSEDFRRVGQKHFCEVQESFAKLFNALEQRNAEGLPLVLNEAVRQALVSLSLLNRQPYTTFSRFISEGRALPLRPDAFDEIVDLLVQGSYTDLGQVAAVAWKFYASLEQLWMAQGVALTDESIDPRLPNR